MPSMHQLHYGIAEYVSCGCWDARTLLRDTFKEHLAGTCDQSSLSYLICTLVAFILDKIWSKWSPWFCEGGLRPVCKHLGGHLLLTWVFPFLTVWSIISVTVIGWVFEASYLLLWLAECFISHRGHWAWCMKTSREGETYKGGSHQDCLAGILVSFINLLMVRVWSKTFIHL